jgi:hypothetical protein
MDLTLTSLWQWTKLTVRAPETASALVKAAKLPIEVSIMMIALAGIVSGVSSGFLDYLSGAPPVEFLMGDGQTLSFEHSGPLMQGIYAVGTGLAMAYAIFQVGKRMGGKGSLADIMAVTAVLQLVMTLILLAQTVALLVVPAFGFGILIFGLYIFFRGLGHVVFCQIGANDISSCDIQSKVQLAPRLTFGLCFMLFLQPFAFTKYLQTRTIHS